MLLLKILLVTIFFIILYQDYKDRLVYWFLYPLIGILVFVLQLTALPINTVLLNSGVNLIFVSLLLVVCYVYTKLRDIDFKDSFGLGDVLFFIFISFSFSIISFFVLFLFSLLFSLLLHFFLSVNQKKKEVPLAGYMSLFFGVVYGITFFYESNFLYAY